MNDVGQSHQFDDDGNPIEGYIAADMNCDGIISDAPGISDADAYALARWDLPTYQSTYPWCNYLNGDMNGDGVLDADDDQLFADYLDGHDGASGLRQAYAWDGENRLVQVGPDEVQTVPAGAKRIKFAYDYMGRRIWKQVETYQSGNWVATQVRKFVWAGAGTGAWLMLMELDGLNNNGVVRKYTWGLDLAGQNGAVGRSSTSLEGAGGIGGLLSVEQPGSPTLKYVYFHDANGNVGQVIDPLAASASASMKVRYEYDPYGTRTNPQQIGEFDQPFRFSTKYFDGESGLYYFGYRYYHPKLGRWMSRDALGEDGGTNIYCYLSNGSPNQYDALGLCGDDCEDALKKALDDARVKDMKKFLGACWKDPQCGKVSFCGDHGFGQAGASGGVTESRDVTMCGSFDTEQLLHELIHLSQNCKSVTEPEDPKKPKDPNKPPKRKPVDNPPPKDTDMPCREVAASRGSGECNDWNGTQGQIAGFTSYDDCIKKSCIADTKAYCDYYQKKGQGARGRSRRRSVRRVRGVSPAGNGLADSSVPRSEGANAVGCGIPDVLCPTAARSGTTPPDGSRSGEPETA